MSEMDRVKSGINRNFQPDPSIPPRRESRNWKTIIFSPKTVPQAACGEHPPRHFSYFMVVELSQFLYQPGFEGDGRIQNLDASID